MSNPGSRSNDDKLLAKIKDLEAEVEDLKRHTHPDRSWGKRALAAASGLDYLWVASSGPPSDIATATQTEMTLDQTFGSSGETFSADGTGVAFNEDCLYVAIGLVSWQANATGYRRLLLTGDITGNAEQILPANTGGERTMNLVVAPGESFGGDPLRLSVTQTSGGPLGMSQIVDLVVVRLG